MLKVRGAPVEFAPSEFAVELTDWIQYGSLPDNELLTAILRNELGHTVALTGSNAYSWRIVREALRWLWAFAPPACFGSRQAVDRWEASGGRNHHK